MTDGQGPAASGSAALEARVAAAHDLLARVRRALAGGELLELERLAPLLEALASQVGRLPRTDQRLRAHLLALLDEAGRLAETLRQEQARLAVQLRAAGAHRRAGTAYRRASRL
jgi:hypothetical protein